MLGQMQSRNFRLRHSTALAAAAAARAAARRAGATSTDENAHVGYVDEMQQ